MLDLRHKFECTPDGTMFVTGFFGDKGNSSPTFVLSRQTLAEMANDENKYREQMSEIRKIIENQKDNQTGKLEVKKI